MSIIKYGKINVQNQVQRKYLQKEIDRYKKIVIINASRENFVHKLHV